MKHGFTIQTTHKRITAGILALLLVFLASCTSEPADTVSVESVASETSKPESNADESATESIQETFSQTDSSQPENPPVEEVEKHVPYTGKLPDDVLTYSNTYRSGAPIYVTYSSSFYGEDRKFGGFLTKLLEEKTYASDQKFEVILLNIWYRNPGQEVRQELIADGFVTLGSGGIIKLTEKGKQDRAEHIKQLGADVYYSIDTQYANTSQTHRIQVTQYYAVLTLEQMEELRAYGGYSFDLAYYPSGTELYQA